MEIKGTVKNGVIVPDDPEELEEGMRVFIVPHWKVGPVGPLPESLLTLRNRTDAEIEADRARLRSQSRPPLELPEGKTLAEMQPIHRPTDELEEEPAGDLQRVS